MAWQRGGRSMAAVTLAAVVLVVSGVVAGCAPPPGDSGDTCWQKRAYYQARNPGLKETLGSGTIHSAPCVLRSIGGPCRARCWAARHCASTC